MRYETNGFKHCSVPYISHMIFFLVWSLSNSVTDKWSELFCMVTRECNFAFHFWHVVNISWQWIYAFHSCDFGFLFFCFLVFEITSSALRKMCYAAMQCIFLVYFGGLIFVFPLLLVSDSLFRIVLGQYKGIGRVMKKYAGRWLVTY